MIVQDYLKNKEHYLRSKGKAENIMMYPDIYNCICQNPKPKIEDILSLEL